MKIFINLCWLKLFVVWYLVYNKKFFNCFRMVFVFCLYLFICLDLEIENFLILLNIFVIKFLLIVFDINIGIGILGILGRYFNVEFLFLCESVFLMLEDWSKVLFDMIVF